MTPAPARARTAAVLLLPVLALGSVTGCVSVGGAGDDARPKEVSSDVAGAAGASGGTWQDGGVVVPGSGPGGVEGRPGALAPAAGSPSVSAEESVPGPTQGPGRSPGVKSPVLPSSSGQPSQSSPSSPPSDRPSATSSPGDSSPPPSGGGSPEPSPSSAPSANGAAGGAGEPEAPGEPEKRAA